MTTWTTNDENKYQRALIDPAYAAQSAKQAEEAARVRREIRAYYSKTLGMVTIPE